MGIAERLYTVEEFEHLPDPSEGGKMELLDGRVSLMAPVGPEHGRLAVRVAHALLDFVNQHVPGDVMVETGFHLDADEQTVLAPDVSFVSRERESVVAVTHGFAIGVPDLAVEVVSPADLDRDVHDKVVLYLAAGCPRVWVVRPSTRTLAIHRPDGTARVLIATDSLTSEDAGFSVEGFALPLADLFR